VVVEVLVMDVVSEVTDMEVGEAVAPDPLTIAADPDAVVADGAVMVMVDGTKLSNPIPDSNLFFVDS
jgi:hypothetical protein